MFPVDPQRLEKLAPEINDEVEWDEWGSLVLEWVDIFCVNKTTHS